MNKEQVRIAKEELSHWLAFPSELGKVPARIRCMGMLEYSELRYYIFKYKKSFFGPWLLGYSGGFEGEDTDPQGQAFSEMRPYSPQTAEAECRAMLDMIADYWKQRAGL